jgi:hypothetical protein
MPSISRGTFGSCRSHSHIKKLSALASLLPSTTRRPGGMICLYPLSAHRGPWEWSRGGPPSTHCCRSSWPIRTSPSNCPDIARSRCSVRDFARMWRSRSGRRDPGGAASFGGERRCVEFPRGNSISLPRLPRAGKGSMTSPRPTVAWPSKRRLSELVK